MIGTHTVLGSLSSKDIDFTFLKYESWVDIKKIYESPDSMLTSTVYDGYPFKVYFNKDWIITIEGMIFNFSDENVRDHCLDIINYIEEPSLFKSSIRSLVEYADGEFIIQLYNTKTEEYLIFNDYLGILPIYYSITKDYAILSRTTKFHLKYLPDYQYSRAGISEILCFDFFIGNSTLFENIEALAPATCIHITRKEVGFSHSIEQVCDINFNYERKFADREEAVSVLADKLIESCQCRVKKLQEDGYSLFHTLSGGFDSRLVLAMLSHCPIKKLHNVTYEYIRDESIVSQEVHNKIRISGIKEFVKLSFNNDYSNRDMPLMQYVTDGRVNSFTTAVCYTDSLYFHNQLLSTHKSVVFSGMGGEFFRHPFKRNIGKINPSYLIRIGVYGRSVKAIQKTLHLRKLHFLDKINHYKETSIKDQLKHLYYEYYLNFVIRAGVDRNRIFAYQIQPIMSVEVMKVLMHNIPLDWVDFRFFINVMAKISPETLDIPIYNSTIDLKSEKSINQYDKDFSHQLSLKKKAKLLLKEIMPISRKVHYKHTKELMALYEKYSSPGISQLFDKEFLCKNIEQFGNKQNAVLSLMMYFHQLEKNKGR